MDKVKRGSGWLSIREAFNESFQDGSEDASAVSTTCSIPVRSRSQRRQNGDIPMKGVKERIAGSWRLKDECIGRDPTLDETEGSESVLSSSRCSMPGVTKEKKKIGDFWKNAYGEKTENILELSYGIHRSQIELIDSMQELLYNFRAIEKKMLQNDKDFTSKFDNLEQMISKIKIIPAGIEVKRGSKISVNTRNKKKKKRRKAVMVEKAQKDLTIKKIPKSDESKHMICQSIKPNYHFQACTDDELHVLADAFDVAQFTSGSVISAQFEKLEYFYVIEEGSVDIFIDGEYIRSVKSFETFGDESLVLGCSNTSTFRARDDCKLWAINRIDYRNITGHYRRKRLELKTNFLRNVKFGNQRLGDILDASDIDSLALATSSGCFKKGDIIIKEGDKGDVFYMIEEGTVNVHKEALGDKVLVALKSGNFFGEKALFSNDVRTASCVADDDVKCLIIVRDDFVRLFGDLQELLDKSQKMVDDSFIKKDRISKVVKNIDSEVHQKNNIDIKLEQLDVKHELGAGSFSTVKLVTFKDKFRRQNPFPGTESFALKLSSKKLLDENKLMDHVKNETNILREIDHPFIIRYFHDFEDDDTIYFLLEAVLGDELYNVLYEEVMFSEQWSRFYAASVVLAFGEIHNKKIAYRDLKPENLMLDSTGFIKMVDFGFAKKVDSGKTWTLCGTPDYFAPELIQNEGHDWAVDYWGLGVLLFEMITGAPPFSGNTELDIYKNILTATIKYPPTISPELKDLIKCLCTIDQSKRLGRTKGGSESVKQHNWFSTFAFESLLRKELKSPYIPKLKTDDDYSAHDSGSMRNSRARKSSDKNSSYQSIIKERNSLTRNGNGASIDKNEDEANTKNRPSIVRFSSEIEKKFVEENKKGVSIKQNDENSPAVSISSPSTIAINFQSVPLEAENEFCLESKIEKVKTIDGRVGKPAIRNSIRNRKQSYMFGDNRYKQQLQEFMNQQHRRQSQQSQDLVSAAEQVKNDLKDFIDEDDSINSAHSSNKMPPIIESHESANDLLETTEKSHDNNHTSFDQFFLLSVAPQSFHLACVDHNFGTGYLDSFNCRNVDLIDQYPPTETSSNSFMTFEEISLSCFTSGVKIRILPCSALEGAKRLGWIGKKADDYQMHTFTDESGKERYGLSIIIREEVTHTCIDTLKNLRLRRKAAVTVCRFFKRFKKNLLRSKKKKGSVGKSFAYSIRRLSDPVHDRLEDSTQHRTNSSTSVEATSNAGNSYKYHTYSVRNKAKESYRIMLRNDRLGEICIVEKCFVFIGTKLDEQCLLLCALKQLADHERMNTMDSDMDGSARRKMSVVQALSKAKTAILGKNSELKDNRHAMLNSIQTKLYLSPEQARVHYPKGELEHVRRKSPRCHFDPLLESLPSISLPLPLPQISGEYAVTGLLLRVKSSGLLVLLNLLLLERSLLVIGRNRAEVTSCTCALLDLLKPYKWASAFIPLIPTDMLDFVSSPVPFIAGIVEEKKANLKYIEEDYRVKDAVNDGMSILNIDSGRIVVTTEQGIEDVARNSHGVIHGRLACYHRRLEQLSKDKQTNLLSFQDFFQQGSTHQESLTIHSLKRAICEHFTNVFKTLSEDPEEWKNYGEFNIDTKAFEYYPYRLVTPLQTNLNFQQMLAHTQLFIGFMEEMKNSFIYPNKNAALLIADWLYFRRRIQSKKRNIEFLDDFDDANNMRKNSIMKINDCPDLDSSFMGWS